MVDFNQALIGAFLRLSSRREKLDLLQKQLAALEQQVVDANQVCDNLQARLRDNEVTGQLASVQTQLLQGHMEQARQHLAGLHQQEEQLSNQLMPEVMQLVEQSVKELAPPRQPTGLGDQPDPH